MTVFIISKEREGRRGAVPRSRVQYVFGLRVKSLLSRAPPTSAATCRRQRQRRRRADEGHQQGVRLARGFCQRTVNQPLKASSSTFIIYS